MVFQILCFLGIIFLLFYFRIVELMVIICFAIPNQLSGLVARLRGRSYPKVSLIIALISTFAIHAAVILVLLSWLNVILDGQSVYDQTVPWTLSGLAIWFMLLIPPIIDDERKRKFDDKPVKTYYDVNNYFRGQLIGMVAALLFVVFTILWMESVAYTKYPICALAVFVLLANLIVAYRFRSKRWRTRRGGDGDETDGTASQ